MAVFDFVALISQQSFNVTHSLLDVKVTQVALLWVELEPHHIGGALKDIQQALRIKVTEVHKQEVDCFLGGVEGLVEELEAGSAACLDLVASAQQKSGFSHQKAVNVRELRLDLNVEGFVEAVQSQVTKLVDHFVHH